MASWINVTVMKELADKFNMNTFCGIFFMVMYVLHFTCVGASSLCPKGWHYSNLRCYKIEVYKETWFDRSWSSARDSCKEEGGDLVAYNSALEAYSIHQYLKDAGIKDKNLYWIGLNDANDDGIYHWVDRSPLTYTNWYNGARPTWLTTLSKTDEPHQVVSSGKGIWYDVTDHWHARIGDCNEPSGFVCEKRANLDIYSTILDDQRMRKPSHHHHHRIKEKLKLVLGPRRAKYHLRKQYTKSTVPTLVYDDYDHRHGYDLNSVKHSINYNIHKHNRITNMVKTWGPKIHVGQYPITRSGKPSTTVVYNLTTTATEGVSTTPLYRHHSTQETTTVTSNPTTTVSTFETTTSNQNIKTSSSVPSTTAPTTSSSPMTTSTQSSTSTVNIRLRNMDQTEPTVIIPRKTTADLTTTNVPYHYSESTAGTPGGTTQSVKRAALPSTTVTQHQSTTGYPTSTSNPSGTHYTTTANTPTANKRNHLYSTTSHPQSQPQYNSNNMYTTTLPPLDKVYHKGYHVQLFGQNNPPLPEANHGLPWKPIKTQNNMDNQGLHAAWLANVAMEPVYNFVNVTAFCETAGTGLHPHPLHCWQFVVCGVVYGGNREGFCYPGRAFHTLYNGCIEDKTCIYGARLVSVKKHIERNG